MSTYLQPPTEKEKESLEFISKNLKGKLLEDDVHFILDDHTFLRFLRHKDGKKDKALKLLEESIEWRRSYKPHQIRLEEVWEWASQGISFCAGVTKLGVPICHLRPVLGLKVDVDKRVRYAAWMYEELMRRGYREAVFVGDFSGVDAVPGDDEKKVREQMDELRAKNYPLFDTKLFLVNLPLVLRAILAVAVAFMSSAQRQTMHTGLKPKHLLEWISEDELPERLGGKRKILTKAAGEIDVEKMFPAVACA